MKKSAFIPFAKAIKLFASYELSRYNFRFSMFKIINPYKEPSFSNLRKIGEYTSLYELPTLSRNEISQLYVVKM